jgi:hypothetical protein
MNAFNFLSKKTVEAVDLSVLNKMGDGTRFTPDVPDLERREKQFLFVPDEMMEHHYDHARLGVGATKVAMALTQDKFSLWKRKLSTGPSVIPLEKGYGSLSSIRGELFLIRSQQMFKLDTHRQNGVEYKRTRIKLIIPYTETRLHYGQSGYYEEVVKKLDHSLNAWMYVGVDEFWTDKLDGGYEFATVRRFHPKNNLFKEPYYYFTNKEYG